jgi:hypothetical protein
LNYRWHGGFLKAIWIFITPSSTFAAIVVHPYFSGISDAVTERVCALIKVIKNFMRVR